MPEPGSRETTEMRLEALGCVRTDITSWPEDLPESDLIKISELNEVCERLDFNSGVIVVVLENDEGYMGEIIKSDGTKYRDKSGFSYVVGGTIDELEGEILKALESILKEGDE